MVRPGWFNQWLNHLDPFHWQHRLQLRMYSIHPSGVGLHPGALILVSTDFKSFAKLRMCSTCKWYKKQPSLAQGLVLVLFSVHGFSAQLLCIFSTCAKISHASSKLQNNLAQGSWLTQWLHNRFCVYQWKGWSCGRIWSGWAGRWPYQVDGVIPPGALSQPLLVGMELV